MKKGGLIILFFTGWVSAVFSQCTETESALRRSDATALSVYFASSVELTIGEKEVIYGKEQAKRMVADFFAKNAPARYATLHKSDSGNSKYIIGNYSGKTGKFRVYVSFFNEGDKLVIRTLKFETE
jgi:hypothetical protein